MTAADEMVEGGHLHLSLEVGLTRKEAIRRYGREVVEDFERDRMRITGRQAITLNADLKRYTEALQAGIHSYREMRAAVGYPVTPQHIQQRRTKGWRKPEGAKSVVRGTEYGNPFRVGDRLSFDIDKSHGQLGGSWQTRSWGGAIEEISPALAVALFRDWTLARVSIDTIRRDLAGFDLMCFCKIGEPCHADWLLKIANGATDV